MTIFQNSSKNFQEEVEVRGHLIDSMILTRIMDRIMDLKGEFEVVEFRVGKRKTDYSYAKLIVRGESREHLQRLLQEVYRNGALPLEVQEIRLEPAPQDMVMPDDFYSTTNNPTFIYLNNDWIEVEDMMMDKAIVVEPNLRRARCKAIRDIRRGDLIAVGELGIKVVPPERPREGIGVFQFMSSISSTEKPTPTLARTIAHDLYYTKKSGDRIVIVAGPAIIHTGASEALSKLIRMRYVDAILAGNALAVHDIEYALYGTSLGVYVSNGSSALRGHRNHMAAINEIFKAGGLKKLVESGRVRRGIIYECIKNGIPFILAASIRDDGPIPDVVMDVVEAQRRYKELLRDVNIVLMLSSMLHSIAVGNMIPSDVKVVAVDINPSSVTKLLDRGTGQAIGVVSDVGAFLPLLVEYLEELTSEKP